MRILYLLILSLTFLPLSGDDHDVVKPGGEVGEFHYFDVLNPAAFVGAMDKFHASNCSKTWHSESGAAVALMGITGSGWTHFIYVGYENLDQMEKGRALLQCPEFFELIATLRAVSNEEAYLSQVGDLSLQLRDWTKDAFFMKFDMRVKPGSAGVYAAAWTEYVEASSSQIGGSAGLVSMLGGTGYSSHMAFVGADSMSELVSGLQSSQSGQAYNDFIEAVGDTREIRNQMFVQPLKGYQ